MRLGPSPWVGMRPMRYVRAGRPACGGVVAAGALRTVNHGSVVVAVAERPRCGVDGLAIAPADEALTCVHSTLIGAASSVVDTVVAACLATSTSGILGPAVGRAVGRLGDRGTAWFGADSRDYALSPGALPAEKPVARW